MFCFKCGEAIPDASEFCPMCGAKLKEAQQTIIYASQKEPVVEPSQKGMTKAGLNNKNVFILWGILAVVSFVFTAMNYMSVSVSVLFRILPDRVFRRNSSYFWHNGYFTDYNQYFCYCCGWFGYLGQTGKAVNFKESNAVSKHCVSNCYHYSIFSFTVIIIGI